MEQDCTRFAEDQCLFSLLLNPTEVVFRGPNTSPRNRCRAVETTARSRNPTFVGFEEKKNNPIYPVLICFFEPHEGGVLLSSRGFNRRLMVARRQLASADNQT